MRCRNDSPCPHPNYMHRWPTNEDPRYTCRVKGCDCEKRGKEMKCPNDPPCPDPLIVHVYEGDRYVCRMFECWCGKRDLEDVDTELT